MFILWKFAFVLGVAFLLFVLYVIIKAVTALARGRSRILLLSACMVIWFCVSYVVIDSVDKISMSQPESLSKSVRILKDVYEHVLKYQEQNGQAPPSLEAITWKTGDIERCAISKAYEYHNGCCLGDETPLCWDRAPHVIRHAFLSFRNETVWCVLFANGRIRILKKNPADLEHVCKTPTCENK